MIYLNGSYYLGNFQDGKKEGDGILYDTLGKIYKGSFKNDKRHGQCEERYLNGNVFRGTY